MVEGCSCCVYFRRCLCGQRMLLFPVVVAMIGRFPLFRSCFSLTGGGKSGEN